MLNIINIEDSDKDVQRVLTTPSAEVNFPLTEQDKSEIAQIVERLNELGGVGLAAPQVNIHKRIITILIPEIAVALRNNAEQPVPMQVLINPSYEPLPDSEKYADWEGCYSVLETMGKVRRYDKIKLTYQDEQGNLIKTEVDGFYARVLQHEIDHINGKLIIHRLEKDDLQGTPEEMRDLQIAEYTPRQVELLRNHLENHEESD